MGSNFLFLQKDFYAFEQIALSAERLCYADPPAALIKLRLLSEKIVFFLLKEHSIDLSIQPSGVLHNGLAELKKEQILPNRIFDLADDIRKKGNNAAHENKGTEREALICLRNAFEIACWLQRAYGNALLDSSLGFQNPPKIDYSKQISELETSERQLTAAIETIQADLAAKNATVSIYEKRQKALIAFELAEKIELTEAQTRQIIDEQLRLAGWEADTETLNAWKCNTKPAPNRFIAIAEWPLKNGKRADYALFIGLKLYGFIEAKKQSKDVLSALLQAKAYAEMINEQDILNQTWKCTDSE